MRGEYKVPQGKLVAVDVDVIDSRLANTKISGDFFLEPAEALEDINASINGMPEDSSVKELAQAIEANLTATMIGFSPEAVGIAIRRALGKAIGWEDLTFDVIPPVVLSPAMHVALDEVIAEEVSNGTRNPTLRFWDWDRGAVVIGSFQSYRNEIDDENAKKYGIQVIRRITGGGAMFMEPGNCVTYSLVVPGSLVEGLSFERSYAFLDDWALGALQEVGVNATYVPLNDISSDKGKIGGAAQRRFTDGTVLHHVTSSYDIDVDKMLKVLRIGREKLSDKGTKSANKRVDPMRSQTGMTRAAILDSFRNYFKNRYKCVDSTYREEELAKARELLRTKFENDEWTKRVP